MLRHKGTDFDKSLPLSELIDQMILVNCDKNCYFILSKRLKKAGTNEKILYLNTVSKLENEALHANHDEESHRRLFLLGLIFHYGIGIMKNPEKAYSYLKQAGAIDPHVRKEIKSLLPDLRKDARMGDSQALFDMANIYEHGLGPKKNLEIAIHLYEDAAAMGSADALFKLGMMYAYGCGVPSDSYKAAQYLRQAYDSKNLSEKYHPFLRAEAKQLLDKNENPEGSYHLAIILKDKNVLNEIAEKNPKKFKELCKDEIIKIIPMLQPDTLRNLSLNPKNLITMKSEKIISSKPSWLGKIKKIFKK